jgi:putative FmdB family regulatory protein
MPIYGFHCECGAEKDVVLPMEKRNDPLQCLCGKQMKRVITLAAFKILHSGRTRVLGALNKEVGYNLPAGPQDRTRMEYVLNRSINKEKPVRGIGF